MAALDPRKKEEARQRREALKKQVRHPYITGQGLKGDEPAPAPAGSADRKKPSPSA